MTTFAELVDNAQHHLVRQLLYLKRCFGHKAGIGIVVFPDKTDHCRTVTELVEHGHVPSGLEWIDEFIPSIPTVYAAPTDDVLLFPSTADDGPECPWVTARREQEAAKVRARVKRRPTRTIAMKIHVSGRDEVNDVIGGCSGSVCVVSITDVDTEPAVINHPEPQILRLCFNDFDRIIPDRSDLAYFTESHAMDISEFVHRQMCDNIVIHCEMGISRSPAIAAALANHFGLPEKYKWLREYLANSMVFTIMMNELGFVVHRT